MSMRHSEHGIPTLHEIRLNRGGRLPLDEALSIAVGVLKALRTVHRLGLAHRHLTPDAILIDPKDGISITDFRPFVTMEGLHSTDEPELLAYVRYLAPEQVIGATADSRCSLYALGAVLYEALAGQPPFDADHSAAIIGQILQSPLPSLRALRPTVPADVERFIMRLMQKRPDDRFDSPQEALDALNGLITTTPATPTLGTAVADPAAALEAERQRMAESLRTTVIESLNLLLAQAAIYEQTLGATPSARLAVSVLTSLARQALGQARDLEAMLHPALVEQAGLAAALESLAMQTMRAHGVHITLALERRRERLPAPMELAIFRAAQEALNVVVQQGKASRLTIRLAHTAEATSLTVTSVMRATEAMIAALRTAGRDVEPFGGVGEIEADGEQLTVRWRVPSAAHTALTERELEVLRSLAGGLSNKEIAKTLVISPRTVKFHLDNVYSKLGVNTRSGAVAYALQHRLL